MLGPPGPLVHRTSPTELASFTRALGAENIHRTTHDHLHDRQDHTDAMRVRRSRAVPSRRALRGSSRRRYRATCPGGPAPVPARRSGYTAWRGHRSRATARGLPAHDRERQRPERGTLSRDDQGAAICCRCSRPRRGSTQVRALLYRGAPATAVARSASPPTPARTRGHHRHSRTSSGHARPGRSTVIDLAGDPVATRSHSGAKRLDS